jgi:hypothetical protein
MPLGEAPVSDARLGGWGLGAGGGEAFVSRHR